MLMLCPTFRLGARAAAIAIAAGSLFAAAPGLATPVTYDLSAGQLTTVQVGTSASGSPCPIGSGSCLQGGPLALTSAIVTVDSATNQLLSVSISIAGSGTLDLGGFNGLQTVSFANTSLVSSSISPLSNPQVQGSGAVAYGFGFLGNVTSTVTPSGGSPTTIQFPSGAGGILTVGPSGLSLQLFGANIGVACGVGAQCQQIKADFTLTANPIPEPGAVSAFGAGLALVGLALRRRPRR